MKLLYGLAVLLLAAGVTGGEAPFFTENFAPGRRSAWQLVPGAVWKGNDTLEITVTPENALKPNKATRKIDLRSCRGSFITFTGEIEGENISKPRQSWLGGKFMLYVNSPSLGKRWAHPSGIAGSFGWKEFWFSAYVPEDVDSGELMLGLEESSGTIRFRNIKAFRFPIPKGKFVRAEYSRPDSQTTRYRGAMFAPTFVEKNVRDLAEWGANLIRWQFVRDWGKADTDTDIPEYRAWIDGKLDELDKLLAVAESCGIKVVVDLHSPPGGRYDGTRCKDMRMFHEAEYARAFVEVWKQIAERYRGNRTILGFDLINEPMQSVPSEHGYWELQLEAARAIREIDPERIIIVESNAWAAPEAFHSMRPLPLKDVIYQVHMYNPLTYTHQMVHGDWKNLSPKDLIAYPGTIDGMRYDRETLKQILQPVRDFQLKYGAKIYVGEFSAVRWAPGADRYLEDCISIFEEYGWDWSYHAFREWSGWSVEHSENPKITEPVNGDTVRRRVLLKYFKRNKPE